MSYYADMYCYGCHADEVGITGFKGCLGAVYIGKRWVYAIHIPPTGSSAIAPQAFADFIATFNEPTGKGKLLVFTNGNERGGAADDAKALKRALGKPSTRFYRLTGHAGNAAVVRVRVNGKVVTVQRMNENLAGMVVGGERRVGCYDPMHSKSFADPKTPTNGGWSVVSAGEITKV